jgi:hypothetical protein
MTLYLMKPVGGQKYLVLSSDDEIKQFFTALVPGDEFSLKVLEVSDEEYQGLEGFDGFE